MMPQLDQDAWRFVQSWRRRDRRRVLHWLQRFGTGDVRSLLRKLASLGEFKQEMGREFEVPMVGREGNHWCARFYCGKPWAESTEDRLRQVPDRDIAWACASIAVDALGDAIFTPPRFEYELECAIAEGLLEGGRERVASRAANAPRVSRPTFAEAAE